MKNMKEIKQSEIKDQIIKEIGYRPQTETIAAIAFGIVLLILPWWLFKVIGILSLALAAVSLYFLKDHKVISIAKDGLYIYQNEGNCVFLDYEEISEWGSRNTAINSAQIYFMLKNGQAIQTETYQTGKANYYLLKVLKNKEANEKAITSRSIKREPFYRRWFKR